MAYTKNGSQRELLEFEHRIIGYLHGAQTTLVATYAHQLHEIACVMMCLLSLSISCFLSLIKSIMVHTSDSG